MNIMGKIDGYSWRMTKKANQLSLEIADDFSIEPEDLPLVGFGCAGWVYERSEIDLTEKEFVELAFEHFKQGKLKYLPTVTCACSDL